MLDHPAIGGPAPCSARSATTAVWPVRVGTTNAVGDTVVVLFHGSRRDFDLHEPAYLLTHGHYRNRLAGWFEVGAGDTSPVRAERELAALASRAGIPDHLVVVPGQTHTFLLWRRALAESLPWLVDRTRPERALRAARVPLSVPVRHHGVPVRRVG